MSSSDTTSSATEEEDRNLIYLQRVHFFTHSDCFEFSSKIQDSGILLSGIEPLKISGESQIIRINNKDCRELNRYV